MNSRYSPPAWGLGKEVTTPCHRTPACYKILNRASDLDGFFGTTYGMGNGYEIWNMKCEESLLASFTENHSKHISGV